MLCDLPFDVRVARRGTYRTTLDNERLHIFLDNSARTALSPTVLVQVKSELLWSQGFALAYQQVLKVMDSLFTDGITGEKVSRVDLCADFECESGFDASQIDMFSTKVRKRTSEWDGKRFCGFCIGKDTLRATIYNKSYQAQTSGKTWVYPLWGSVRFPVWRVEFQFKREVLRRRGIETISDLIAQSQALWDYAAKWLQMREGHDSNKTRWPLTEFWKLVQAVKFDLWADTPQFEFPEGQGSNLDKARFISIVAGLTKSYARNNGFDDPWLALNNALPELRIILSR